MDERRRRFCQAIVAGVPKGDAAAQAGYSKRTAPSIASRLLKQKMVKDEIERLRTKRDEKIESDERARLKDSYESSLELLRDVYNNPKMPFSVRVAAAKDALPYEHAKPAPKSKKKDAKDDANETAAKGKFGVGRRPQLRSVA